MPVVRSRLLDRSLLYTGLTRGVEQIIFIGDREALSKAIKEEPKSVVLQKFSGYTRRWAFTTLKAATNCGQNSFCNTTDYGG